MNQQTTSREPRAIPARACVRGAGWPLERALFAIAGTITLLSVLLGALVSDWFLLLAVLAGANQWLYVLAGVCPASFLVARLGGLRSVVYVPEDRS